MLLFGVVNILFRKYIIINSYLLANNVLDCHVDKDLLYLSQATRQVRKGYNLSDPRFDKEKAIR